MATSQNSSRPSTNKQSWTCSSIFFEGSNHGNGNPFVDSSPRRTFYHPSSGVQETQVKKGRHHSAGRRTVRLAFTPTLPNNVTFSGEGRHCRHDGRASVSDYWQPTMQENTSAELSTPAAHTAAKNQALNSLEHPATSTSPTSSSTEPVLASYVQRFREADGVTTASRDGSMEEPEFWWHNEDNFSNALASSRSTATPDEEAGSGRSSEPGACTSCALRSPQSSGTSSTGGDGSSIGACCSGSSISSALNLPLPRVLDKQFAQDGTSESTSEREGVRQQRVLEHTCLGHGTQPTPSDQIQSEQGRTKPIDNMSTLEAPIKDEVQTQGNAGNDKEDYCTDVLERWRRRHRYYRAMGHPATLESGLHHAHMSYLNRDVGVTHCQHNHYDQAAPFCNRHSSTLRVQGKHTASPYTSSHVPVYSQHPAPPVWGRRQCCTCTTSRSASLPQQSATELTIPRGGDRLEETRRLIRRLRMQLR
eukprot:scpid57099/ scgid33401/ 